MMPEWSNEKVLYLYHGRVEETVDSSAFLLGQKHVEKDVAWVH